jgi:glutamyl-tRNA synthetase
MAQARITKMSDLGGLTAMFFMNRIDGMSAERLRDGVKLEQDMQRAAYTLGLQQFDGLINWNREGVEATLRRTAEVLDAKLKDVIRPFYIAITGRACPCSTRSRIRAATSCASGCAMRWNCLALPHQKK